MKDTVPPQLLCFLEELEEPRQIVSILRHYLAAPEKVMQIVSSSGNYAQAMLELGRADSLPPLPRKDIPIARTDLTRYDSLLQRRDVI